jgi:multidrug transporter EmrE-like cation transporter
MSAPYPVSVEATLDRPSRWLWLLKWLLLVPHYVVLPFLWVSYVVLTGIALVAIVVTGRYPRSIFDFNVGVLRWSWRVASYGYGALSTDRYPPFSLAPRFDYPVELDVDYPGRLSRGLALVKWWLLAIPHYLVVSLLVGGGGFALTGEELGGWGLIGILVVVAGVLLLVTGRYPQPLFDLVLGLNRWVIRVVTYASLMTDAYPPFRLDQGAAEPAHDSSLRPDRGRPRASWRVSQVIGVVASSLLLVVALGMLAGGLAARFVDATGRDADGFIVGTVVDVHSDGYAVIVEDVESRAAHGLPDQLLGDVEIQAHAEGDPVFVGVARAADVRAFLYGVEHTVVTEAPAEPEPPYVVVHGGMKPIPPINAGIWIVSASGPGRQTFVMPPERGEWTLVVMRLDGDAPLDVDVSVGASTAWMDDLSYGLLAGGLVLLAVGGLGLLVGLRRPADGAPGSG